MMFVYVDTSCINAKQKDKYLNALENLANKKIWLQRTDTMMTEVKDRYKEGVQKAPFFNEVLGPFTIGHSRIGSAVIANDADVERMDKVLIILFGSKNRDEYEANEIRDAMHVATSIRYVGQLFLTKDKKLLQKAEEIQKEFHMLICTPEVGYKIVMDNLKHSDDIQAKLTKLRKKKS